MTKHRRFSGIYPHLAVFGEERECGIGAVMYWADSLWMINYPPHKPHGSNEKLFQINDQLERITRKESVGGTHANRMIHEPSNQLIIGPYFISAKGDVRVISPEIMPGRLTSVMKHLSDPNKVYFYGMEGEFYEVDVHSLEVTPLPAPNLPGTHSKGGYTAGQRVVISHNGRGGILASWDGEQWTIVEQEKFTEVMGPGGLKGNNRDEDPLWAVGWDERSVILKLLEDGQWLTYRLPKGSYTQDADHGWFTEWPRIRQVSDTDWMLDMHCLFYQFPPHFSKANTAGIRPISSHLKMVVDFTYQDEELVMACNDASQMQNPLVGQAQSNLWFGTMNDLQKFGPTLGFGGPWVCEPIKANTLSDPYHMAGYSERVLHLAHTENSNVSFTMEVDTSGQGDWAKHKTIVVGPQGYGFECLPADLDGEFLRLSVDSAVEKGTAYLHYNSSATMSRPELFTALADVEEAESWNGGLLRPAADGSGDLEYLAYRVGTDGRKSEPVYYRINEELVLQEDSDTDRIDVLKAAACVDQGVFSVDDASVVIRDAEGRSYRLPKTNGAYDEPGPLGYPRAIREVVTERNLANIHGTFYELPREESGGLRKIKPVATHGKRIYDYCSWRGMLVLAGITQDTKDSNHSVGNDVGDGLWLGNVDDLWALGRPVGQGGPWENSFAKGQEPSDPYLMLGYGQKTLQLSHESSSEITITVEVDVLGEDVWHSYGSFKVPAGEVVRHVFPQGYSAHWVRFVTDQDAKVTANLIYQ